MSDANVVKLLQPGSFADPLTEVLRNGARALLAQAIEAEVAEFLAKHVDLKTATGLSRVVRHGHLPEREVMTGIGPVGVRQPRVRDRGAADDAGRIRFTPAILPPYARRRGAWRCWSRSFTLRASRPTISRRRLRPCSARMHRACRPRLLLG